MREIRGIIEGVILREGKYVDHPDDRGGPTMWGITEATARAAGYQGAMSALPREVAADIYLNQYFVEPGFRDVLMLPWTAALTEELVDTGVNMGPQVASKFLQRTLNAFNRKGELYEDLTVDGNIGQRTLAALRKFIEHRGPEGVIVMVRALNCLQGARYVELCEAREQNESFVYGWMKDRVL